MGDHTSGVAECAIGVDLGDREAWFCVVDAHGKVVERGRVAMTERAMRKEFEGQESTRIAVEVGTHSPWVSRVLEEWGHEVVVANPRQLPLIFQSNKKSDGLDAEHLARLARFDPSLLAPVRHRGREAHADLAVLRSRDALVGVRTNLVNHVRGTVKSFGSRLPGSSTHYFHKRVVDEVPEELRPALYPVLEALERDGALSGAEPIEGGKHGGALAVSMVSALNTVRSVVAGITVSIPFSPNRSSRLSNTSLPSRSPKYRRSPAYTCPSSPRVSIRSLGS